jgi:glycine oxidase
MATTFDILVEGAGLIGLAIAEALSRRGLSVAVSDPRPDPINASCAAAGMLAPMAEWLEHGQGDRDELRSLMAAREAWPAFAQRLEADMGTGIGHMAGPSLYLGDVAHLPDEWRPLIAAHEGELTDRLCQDAPQAHWLKADGQVDNRRALIALRELLQARGVVFSEAPVSADCTIAAKGWRSENVEPVKGEALALSPHAAHPDCVVRFPGGYIVPKSDRTVIGATSTPGAEDFDVAPGVAEVLRERAAAIWPGVREGNVIDVWAGLRPKSAGGRPFIDRLDGARLRVGGHFRNGILLAPLTAATVSAMLCGEAMPDGADIFERGEGATTRGAA